MKKKIHKILQSIILILLTLLVVGSVSLFPLTVHAYEWGSVNNIPDPKSIGAKTSDGSLMDSRALQNAYKIWSVAKAAGFSDYAAAGMVGNSECEGGFDPASIEGRLWGTADEMFFYGPAHAKAEANWGLYCLDVFDMYAKSGWEIEESTADDGLHVEHFAGSGAGKIHTAGYKAFGSFAPGIGAFGFTGDRTVKLIKWSKSVGLDWYDMDTQLIHIFRLKGDNTDGLAKSFFLEDYYEQDFKNAYDAGMYYCTVFEGIPAKPKRGKAAEHYYKMFKGSNGDIEYGRKILKKAGFPVRLANAKRSIIDVAMLQELATATIVYKENNGFSFDVDGSSDKQAKEASTELLYSMKEYNESTTQKVNVKGNDILSQKYSLYDLFGPDIHWYRYMGEYTAPVQLLDHVYSAWSQNKMSMLTLGDTVFYKSDRYLSARVYDGRPEPLTFDDVNQGKRDPRLETAKIGRFTGYSFVVGSIYMEIAKFMTNIIGFMLGPKPIEAMYDLFDKFFSSKQYISIVKPVIMFLTMLAVIFWIASFVGVVKRYVAGQASRREMFKRFFVGVFCLGLVFALVITPGAFLSVTKKAATIVDSTFNSVLTSSTIDDDIVGSSSGKHTVEAMLWKTTIFEPWCMGQFGDTYDNLYTIYADVDEDKKIEQSYQSEDELKKLKEDEYLYNSAAYTGDVVVPVGDNHYIRNWAAYLYSCGSKYHIDQGFIDGKTEVPDKDKIMWPNRLTTAYEASIAADTFRVIDAQMDISPQVYKTYEINNYTGSKMLEPHFFSQGHTMFLYALILTVSFLPAIFQKLSNLMKLFLTCIQAIFYAIREVSKEDSGLSEFPEKLKKYGINYLLAALRLYILVIAYTALVGKSILLTMMYIIIAIVTYGFTHDEMHRTISNAKGKVQQTKRVIRNRF